MNLVDKAAQFAESVKTSGEFIELKHAHSLINKNPALKKRVEEIVKKQQAILMQYKPRQKELESKLLELDEELKKVSAIPEVNRYFTAGKNFNIMLSKLFKIINSSIESDLKS